MQPVKMADVANRRSSKRQNPRRTVKVECRKGASGLGPNLAAGFLDLSEGGVRLVLKQAVPQGSEVEVVLVGYGMKEPIKRVANVCWVVSMESGQHAVGLRFQKVVPYRDVQLLSTP
jgi:c-di-GMP-binding flagellar brake protein YcgR